MSWGSGSADEPFALAGAFQFWNPVKGLLGVETALGSESPGVGWESGWGGEASTGKAGLLGEWPLAGCCFCGLALFQP